MIRRAMLKLDARHHRKLDTMNQVPWFEKALRDEIRRRKAAAPAQPTAVAIARSDEVILGLLRTLIEETVKQTQILARIAFGGGPPPSLAEAQANGLVSDAPSPILNTSALRRLIARGANGTNGHRKPN